MCRARPQKMSFSFANVSFVLYHTHWLVATPQFVVVHFIIFEGEREWASDCVPCEWSAMAQVTSARLTNTYGTHTHSLAVVDLSFFTEFRFIILTHFIFGTVVRRFVNFSSLRPDAVVVAAAAYAQWLLREHSISFLLLWFAAFLCFTCAAATVRELILAFMLSHLHSFDNSMTGSSVFVSRHFRYKCIYLTLVVSFVSSHTMWLLQINGLVYVDSMHTGGAVCSKNGRNMAIVLKWRHLTFWPISKLKDKYFFTST